MMGNESGGIGPMDIDQAYAELIKRIKEHALLGSCGSVLGWDDRTYERAVKLPKELVEELARVTTRAQQAWQEARQASDFKAFQPWLEKIVLLKRQEADAIGYKTAPYDALLDEYEPGATTAEITR